MFFKVILLIILVGPFFLAVGYFGIKNPKLYYFVIFFICGQIIIRIIKFLFEENKRIFLADVQKNNIKPCFKFEYEEKEWETLLNTLLKKQRKTAKIVSVSIFIISIILIFIGYSLKNDGEFALGAGYNLFLISIFWYLNSFLFNIHPLQKAKENVKREIKCFK